MEYPYRRPSLTCAIIYKDAAKALDWLERAFGFKRSMIITDPQGNIVHSEMRYGDGMIYIGGEWADFTAAPGTVNGKNTQVVHVHMDEDVQAHCDRARAAGAEIIQEPSNQFYGDRIYRARDPEGHIWSFGQTVRRMSRAQAEQVSGLKIQAPDWD